MVRNQKNLSKRMQYIVILLVRHFTIISGNGIICPTGRKTGVFYIGMVEKTRKNCAGRQKKERSDGTVFFFQKSVLPIQKKSSGGFCW